jgi:hypothetical protein
MQLLLAEVETYLTRRDQPGAGGGAHEAVRRGAEKHCRARTVAAIR